MKTAFFDSKPYDKIWFEPLLKAAGIEYKFFEYKLSAETARLADGYDAVCIFVNDRADAAAIDALYRGGVRLIALRCSGYNNIDFAAAKGKIRIVRVPAYSPSAVAEYTMGLLLAIGRKIPRAYSRTRAGNFSINGLIGFDFEGRTAGIIGTGRIGRNFIRICSGLGMKVVAYDPYPAADSGIDYRPLSELLRVSDVISLHCPLTEETHHIICDKSISQMKDGVLIVNTSRGALIDTGALLDGLKSGKIGGAGLDVYEEEEQYFFEDCSNEVIRDEELLQLLSIPNVVMSSHQAFFTEDALRAIAEVTVDNLRTFFQGKPLKNELCLDCREVTAAR